MRKLIASLALATSSAFGLGIDFPGYFPEDFTPKTDNTAMGCYWAPYSVYTDVNDRTKHVDFTYEGRTVRALFVDGTVFDALDIISQYDEPAASAILDGHGLMVWANLLRGVAFYEHIGISMSRDSPTDRFLGCRDGHCTLQVLIARSGGQILSFDRAPSVPSEPRIVTQPSMSESTRCGSRVWVVFQEGVY